ncbi:hypothetical protein ES708_35109 [subsurface metagenome]
MRGYATTPITSNDVGVTRTATSLALLCSKSKNFLMPAFTLIKLQDKSLYLYIYNLFRLLLPVR